MILYPTYFSPIVQYVAIAKADKLIFEVEDHYQKQSYRTRCYIYGANGKQILNIPVKHVNQSRKTKDIKIDNGSKWQKLHLKALQSAYRSSPYFEFYEEELTTLFVKEKEFLLDFNFKCHDFILSALNLDVSHSTTSEYFKAYNETLDLRFLADAKIVCMFDLQNYTQVFSDKLGFIRNLSILDLLFMEGPNALNYLENQTIEWV